MPVSRMRMRPWLEKMIESNSIDGLHWLDEKKTMFSIPWKHAARHGWEMDKDASLFKCWAIHTGKYSEGKASDPKTWKANFRCAMNSLPDIEEVKNKSINKGHEAVRVFRMLPCHAKSKDKRSKAKESKSRKKCTTHKTEDDTDDSDTQSPVSLTDETVSTQESTIDSTVQTEDGAYGFSMPLAITEWSLTDENGASLVPCDFEHRFEVSPDHSLDEECDNIIELCKHLTQSVASEWRISSDVLESLSNEACTSPESQHSDSSSELEDGPQFTILNSTTDSTEELLLSISNQILSLH